MMFTADQLVAHAVGDYLLQSHWHAQKKTTLFAAALWHAITYTLPFLFITRSPLALLVICLSHAVIDRYRLARFVVWFKNWVGSPDATLVRPEVTATGYPADTPPWLAVWLLIAADNILHVLINAAAIRWLA